MTPTATSLTIISAVEIVAALWIMNLIFPFYRMAQGRVRGLLMAVMLLFCSLIATSIFWIVVLVMPAELRQEGTWGYGVVLAGFVAVQVMPLLTGIYLWRQMRQ
jgi:hypothetical protein